MVDYKLNFKGGPRDGESTTLSGHNSLVFGRDTKCDVQLLDARLSRYHLRLEKKGNEVIVYDLDSTNGTYVNGQRISQANLHHRDEIRLGGSIIEFTNPNRMSTFLSMPGSEMPDFRATISKRYETDEQGLFGCLAQPSLAKDNESKVTLHLRTLISLSTLFSSSLSLETLFQTVIDTACEIFNADHGCLVVKRGRSVEEYFGQPPGLKMDPDWKVSKSIVDKALLQGLSILSGDAGEDDRFKSRKSIVAQSIKAVMCVPVESSDDVLGAIYLDSTTGTRIYMPEDLELLSAVGKQAGMALGREMAKEEKDLLFLDTIRAVIAAIEAKDSYTAGHSARVGEYSAMLSESLGHSQYFIDRLRYAANLHDVGKIGIPENILNKPGRLTEAEFLIIQNHPTIGARILENIRNIEDVIAGVRHHHEKMDGTGYPQGLEGEAIPKMSRLIAVADAFDAMTSDRSYRQALTVADAIDRFERASGTQFDPIFVGQMVNLLEAQTIVPIRTTLKVF